MSIGGIRNKRKYRPGRGRPCMPRTASLCFVVWLSVFRNLHRRRPSVRAKGPDEECKRAAHSTLSAGRRSRAAIYHRQCSLQTCGLVFCFFSPPPQKSSAQPQIGRTAGLEPVRLDAYIGEMIRLSPMRNIGTANIKTHLSWSTENLQYYGAVTCAVLRRPLSYDRSLLFFPSSPFLHLHPRRPR